MSEITKEICREGKAKLETKNGRKGKGCKNRNAITPQGKERRDQTNDADRSQRDRDAETEGGAESEFPPRCCRNIKSLKGKNESSNCEHNKAIEMPSAKKTVGNQRIPCEPGDRLLVNYSKKQRDGKKIGDSEKYFV